MYNDDLKNTIINNLEEKEINLCNTVTVLSSQGFVVNKTKGIKIKFCSILIHLFENIDLFTEEEQTNIENLYNIINMI